jgi:hypothetical protein
VVHACNPSTWKAEVGRLRVKANLGDPVSIKKKKKKGKKQTNKNPWIYRSSKSVQYLPSVLGTSKGKC